MRADPQVVGRIVFSLLIAFVFFYLIYSMAIYGDTYSEKQTYNIETIINKALVQCYALEGGYPVEIEYVEKYGVVFDYDKYVYHYEWYGNNLKPTVMVIEK